MTAATVTAASPATAPLGDPTLLDPTQGSWSRHPAGSARRADDPWARQPAIDLDALVQAASLQDRFDRKYLVPEQVVARLGEALTAAPVAAAVLADGEQRWFGYRSHYFDTRTLASYRMAAHRRPQRYKVRTRSYLDSQSHFLEVKVRDRRGRTVKTRTPWTPDPHWQHPLDAEGTRFVGEVLGRRLDPRAPLRGQLRTDYSRMTVLLADEGARATLDLGLTATDAVGRSVRYAGLAVVETKTSGRPCTVDRLLWSLGHRPIRMSKYATSLAAVRPDLPANRWQPALRRLLLADGGATSPA